MLLRHKILEHALTTFTKKNMWIAKWNILFQKNAPKLEAPIMDVLIKHPCLLTCLDFFMNNF